MDKEKILELIGTDSDYSNSVLRAAGYSAPALMALGYSASDLLALGYSAPAIMAAGYSASALMAFGYSVPDLLALGYSASDLREIEEKIPLVKNLYTKISESLKEDGCKLDQSKWECGSTRCIGGWTEFHGGKAAHDLRIEFGREICYRLIHFKSCGEKTPPPNYGGDVPNKATMAYINARVKEEKTKSKKKK